MEKQIKEIVKAIKKNYKEQRTTTKTTKLLLVQTFNVRNTTWLQFVEIDQIRKCCGFIEIVLSRNSCYEDEVKEVRLQSYQPLEKGTNWIIDSIQTLFKVCNQINGYNDWDEVK